MIDLYYWTTPNGHKITMFLEETGLEYKIFPINIGKGGPVQAGVPGDCANNRIPAMVDHEPKAGPGRSRSSNPARCCCTSPRRPANSCPRSVRPLRRDPVDVLADGRAWADGRAEHHFAITPWKNQIRIDRYVNETNRLYGVLNKRLSDREFIAGEYSIADMASYPWVAGYKNQARKSTTSRI